MGGITLATGGGWPAHRRMRVVAGGSMTHPSASSMNHTPVGRNAGRAKIAVTDVTRDVPGTLFAAGRGPVHPPVAKCCERMSDSHGAPDPSIGTA